MMRKFNKKGSGSGSRDAPASSLGGAAASAIAVQKQQGQPHHPPNHDSAAEAPETSPKNAVQQVSGAVVKDEAALLAAKNYKLAKELVCLFVCARCFGTE
jgi:hypothetical protein